MAPTSHETAVLSRTGVSLESNVPAVCLSLACTLRLLSVNLRKYDDGNGAPLWWNKSMTVVREKETVRRTVATKQRLCFRLAILPTSSMVQKPRSLVLHDIIPVFMAHMHGLWMTGSRCIRLKLG